SKTEVTMDDLFSGSNVYADQLKNQFQAWKKLNPEEAVSENDFRAAMLNTRAFAYTSIQDEQQKKEFWVNVAATVAIVGVAIFCPPAGLVLGAAYGSLEMSEAVTGKDWLTGREMDTSERALRGAFSLFDLVPGVKALSGGTRVLGETGHLAELSQLIMRGKQTAVSKAEDLVRIGKNQAEIRVRSLKGVLADVAHSGVEKLSRSLDTLGKVGAKWENSLNLPPRQQLAMADVGGLGTSGSSKVLAQTEKLQATLQRFDVNLGGGSKTDGIMEKASGATGTVWDDIKGIQPPRGGTTVPKSFEINANGEKLWVNPNGTKHMVEYSTRNLSHGQKLTEQQLLRSFQGAVEKATSTGIKFDTKIIIDNWELIFSPAREAGQLPVIKHAVYLP
ncbi:hypothetical protein MFLO_14732, partial [Listeria floridensis FSL S10-1187]